MATYYPSTCSDIPQNDCNPCEGIELGRIRSFGFIAKDYAFANSDPSDPANWAAGVAAKQIFIINESHGEVGDPSPKTGPGYGQTTERLLGYDFSATVYDPNYKRNYAFYNAIKNSRNFKFFYATSTQIHITDVTVTIIPGAPVTDDLTGEVSWKTNVKWMSGNLVQPLDLPVGLFDECYAGN
jgi:hypothetical protein